MVVPASNADWLLLVGALGAVAVFARVTLRYVLPLPTEEDRAVPTAEPRREDRAA